MIRNLLAVGLLAVAIFIGAACNTTTPLAPSATTAPSGSVSTATAIDDGTVTAKPPAAPDNDITSATTPTMAPTSGTMAVTGSTDVPLVAKSYCGFAPDNPYPCCQNGPGQYGNCTGAAWNYAKSNWRHALPAWGNAGQWAAAAASAGYILEAQPTVGSIGVSTSVWPGHVAPVTSIIGTTVTNYEQQCGAGLTGGNLTRTRSASYFNAGFIRAPIPTVKLLIWNGTNQITNGGILTVRRGWLGAPVGVQFGFSLLRSNVNRGSSSFSWTIGGTVASTAGMFTYNFSKPGSYTIVSTVTNGLGVSTTATATVTVL